jgi:hypothetical protein
MEIDTCPHCGFKLDKIPSRKNKCISCGKYIYVRTRPQDKKKVLVTEEEAKQIDIQWQKQYQNSEDEKLLDSSEFFNAKKELTKSFGKEASISDTKWFVYNKRDFKYLKDCDWNSYRRNLFDKVKLLMLEKRYNQALSLLFQICYLDVIDINYYSENNNFNHNHKIECKSKIGYLAPGIVSMIEEIIKEQKFNSILDLKKVFFESIESISEFNFNVNVTKEEIWTELIKFIGKKDIIKSIDPNNTLNIINEINKRIDQKSFSEASELIYKLKNPFYSKLKNNIDIDLIKENLKKWLYLDDLKINQASESLLNTLIKKEYNLIKHISREYIKNILEINNKKLSWKTVSQFYKIDREFTVLLVPKLIEILKSHPEWCVRRVSSHNIGEIGAEDINLIKDAIPIMLNYIEHPYEVTKKFSNFDLLLDLSYDKVRGIDQKQYLKDAYIDSMKLIIKGNKYEMIKYKSLFEKIAKKDQYESSMYKAKQVLDEFNI